MGKATWLMVLVYLLVVEIQKFRATKVYCIIPDNSINGSCSSESYITLSKYSDRLPVVTNVEYRFLPGEHQIPANMTLTNLTNFSIIGDVSDSSSPAMLIGCDHSYVLKISESQNVSIRNIRFERCYNPQLQLNSYFTSLYIDKCFSCVIENVTFKNFGMVGENLIGQFYLNKIYIIHATGQFCQGITLSYVNHEYFISKEYHLLINKLYITVIGNGIKCYNFNENFNAGVFIYVSIYLNKIRIKITNSFFNRLHSTAMYIWSNCKATRNLISLDNCTFHYISSANEPVVRLKFATLGHFVTFNSCMFKYNFADGSVVSLWIRGGAEFICRSDSVNQSFVTPSNVYFRENQFILNDGNILYLRSLDRIKLYIIGPTNIEHNNPNENLHKDLIIIQNAFVYIYGPLITSHNSAKRNSIWKFVSSEVLFYGMIFFKSNVCNQIISLDMQQPYIRVMEYTNITFYRNMCINKLIKVDSENDNFWYKHCLFQYVISSNKSNAIPNNYAINIIGASTTQQEECSFLYYHLNPNCEWLPNAVFQHYDSEIINHQIIQIDQQRLNYHRICLCYDNESYNCSTNIIGPIYPGQVLQIGLCTPCDDNIFSLYVETHDTFQTNFSCKINNQAEMLNTISNHVNLINYTIGSEAHKMCKLFLTMYFHKQLYAYEVFFVKLLPCPVGFTLQNGVCDCDPILTKYINKCYIDYSAIRRPANIWITAHTQANDTNYLISDCPMDYCLPHSFNINLLYPDQQCQFERTGILCSQCRQPLSMVFGSSRCMKCTNLYILITIIIIVAGIVLVVLLYLLNLTVTKGTINGIILYANIISINDSIFLINDNVFESLKVFISFVNLDLGIETCFYDGMDSYAKMWLQLFFPFYLMIIAVFIIIASRTLLKFFK